MQRNEGFRPVKLLVVIAIVTILPAWVWSGFSLPGISRLESYAFAEQLAEQQKKEPQKGEGKKTQETESQKRQGKTKALLEKISKAIEEYGDTDFDGTDVVIREKRASALEKLTKKFKGREINVVFPIKNVSEHGDYGRRSFFLVRRQCSTFLSGRTVFGLMY